MPTTILTIPDGVLTVRYKEPYVTAGLNAKLAGIVPRGIHRGMRLSTNAAPLTVTMLADPIANDHVAHYLTTGGSALTIRYTGGNGVLLLPASQTLVLAIYATYSVGSPTRGEVRSYTVAEYDALPANAKAELVVLGTVVTPGSGTIPAANISHARRSWAWSEIGQDAVDWVPLHDDPSFEYMPPTNPLDASTLHWWVSGDSASWAVTTTDPAGEKALTLTQTLALATNLDVHQNLYTPVQPGQAVRARLAIKNLQVPAAGTLVLRAVFADSAGASITPTDPLTLDLTGVDSVYRTVDQVFIAPLNAAYLSNVQLFSSSLRYPTLSSPALRLNNFQVWCEPLGQLNNGRGAYRGIGRVVTDHVRIVTGETGALPAASDPVLYKSEANVVGLGRIDNLEDLTHVPPTFDGRGSIRAGAGLESEDIPRLVTSSITSSGTFILMWDTAEGDLAGFRAYSGNDGSMSLVYNARWNSGGSTWDSFDASACRIKLSGTGMRLEKAPFDGSWVESAWLQVSNFAGDFTGGTSTTKAIQYMLSMADTAGQAVRPRTHYHMLTGAGPYRTCLWEAGDYSTGTFAAARCYILNPVSQPEAVFEYVVGAHWDSGANQWVSDASGTSNFSTRVRIDRGDVSYSIHRAGGSFSDSAWTATWSLGHAGSIKAFGGFISALGTVTTNGYNVAGGSVSGSSVLVTLSQAVGTFIVASAPRYVVHVTPVKDDNTPVNYATATYNHASTSFKVAAYSIVDGQPININTDVNAVEYLFSVVGYGS